MSLQKITKEQYPHLLQQIPSLPQSMDLMGVLPSPQSKFLCIIGARNHSKYGEEVCRHLISGLAGHDVVIVSGLAIGIDSISHKSALEANLKTIAFPGSGLSPKVLYPLSKRHLGKKIVESGGALLSPFEYDQMGSFWTFPVRNRLMAGMSHATLVIEGRRHSGTLLTADYAAEFGRDVLAVPGSIFSELSYGPHMLIERGAVPITNSSDILRALGFDIHSGKNKKRAETQSLFELSLSPEEKRMVDLLRNDNLSASEIIERMKISSSQFNVVASNLELRNIITEDDGFYRMGVLG
jgi:DNA processing protein